jgi:dTDP-4-amino-4,6-dideoxygalactose transaminase
MDGIQGAILSVKLAKLDGWIAARRAHAALYNEVLANAPVIPPAPAVDAEHVWHVYAVRARGGARDEIAGRLAAAGIATGLHYPVPVHLQPAYADLGYRRGDFPISEALAESTLSLPMFPELTPLQIERIASTLTSSSRQTGTHANAA